MNQPINQVQVLDGFGMVGPKEPTQQEDNCASSKFGARGGSLELAAAAVHFDRAVIVFQPKGVPKIYNNQGTAGDPIALWYRANHYEMLEGQGAVAAGCTKTYARREGVDQKAAIFHAVLLASLLCRRLRLEIPRAKNGPAV